MDPHNQNEQHLEMETIDLLQLGGAAGAGGWGGSFDCLLRPRTSEFGIKAPFSAGAPPPQVTLVIWKMSSACRNTSQEVRDTLIYIYAQAGLYERCHRLCRRGLQSTGERTRGKEADSVFTRGQIWHSFSLLFSKI